MIEPAPRLLAASLAVLLASAAATATADSHALDWPAVTRECRPAAYWWWMASAVDPANLTRELTRYREAGMGGVHVIPIYGAKGWEDRTRVYWSAEWHDALRHTLREATRLDLFVDLTTGSGWCFGGPTVSDLDANALVVVRTFEAAPGQPITQTFDRTATQALVAFAPDGTSTLLTDRLRPDGSLDWFPPAQPCRLYALTQRPSGQRVKRAAPGGEGHMLNLLYPAAMPRYLERFTDALANLPPPRPRAMYHDSYEYRSDWAPDLLAQFERRRGYRLESELPALFDTNATERSARVKTDYRETVSDLLIEESLPTWTRWSHQLGMLTRNQAHGSPANLLDLYATADIPETEMFRNDREPLVSMLAASAAHVTGRPRVAAETGTWLREHFQETLGDLKRLADDLFLSGVNHVIYHGTCYSPDDAPWPGWLFYASTQMNPRNPVWHDAPALNAYITRCQSVLQSDQPDQDILLYWPIHDLWHNPAGRLQSLTVHHRDWLLDQPIGPLARNLASLGFTFDFISDRQLANTRVEHGRLVTPGSAYHAILVPPCKHLPLATLRSLLGLARAGATVIFANALPDDVPGWHDWERRRDTLRAELAALPLARMSQTLSVNAPPVPLITQGMRARKAKPRPSEGGRKDREVSGQECASGGRFIPCSCNLGAVLPASPDTARREVREISGLGRTTTLESRLVELDRGRVLVGDPVAALTAAGVQREPMSAHPGLSFIRRRTDNGRHYFLVNRGDQTFDGWLPLAHTTASVVALDPWTGQTGVATLKSQPTEPAAVRLRLQPAESVILRTFARHKVSGRPWPIPPAAAGASAPCPGPWTVTFLEGGPQLPANRRIAQLTSWSHWDDPDTAAFAGTARYACDIHLPETHAAPWILDLGRVAQSARVRVDSREIATLILPPFHCPLPPLQPGIHRLEIDVTSTAANRIRDLDQRQVPWRRFHDINFVNSDYKPFDASSWPLAECGLLGPVTLSR
ncbi:MAG TPA: glycosyl hydrolase [Verrucomicrobiota bacterium]|nr:glycosyl hydrolase [Verrucomicrobiota bacterium]HNU52855.1 glycosyl hydrolase [Verrucomicrobiota bacterium]